MVLTTVIVLVDFENDFWGKIKAIKDMDDKKICCLFATKAANNNVKYIKLEGISEVSAILIFFAGFTLSPAWAFEAFLSR